MLLSSLLIPLRLVRLRATTRYRIEVESAQMNSTRRPDGGRETTKDGRWQSCDQTRLRRRRRRPAGGLAGGPTLSTNTHARLVSNQIWLAIRARPKSGRPSAETNPPGWKHQDINATAAAIVSDKHHCEFSARPSSFASGRRRRRRRRAHLAKPERTAVARNNELLGVKLPSSCSARCCVTGEREEAGGVDITALIGRACM